MSRIEDIRARLDAATLGPFEASSIEDCDLIVHASADLRDLLAVADAARDVPVQHEARCVAWLGLDRCDCRVADLNAALARLDAVTGGETS